MDQHQMGLHQQGHVEKVEGVVGYCVMEDAFHDGQLERSFASVADGPDLARADDHAQVYEEVDVP